MNEEQFKWLEEHFDTSAQDVLLCIRLIDFYNEVMHDQ